MNRFPRTLPRQSVPVLAVLTGGLILAFSSNAVLSAKTANVENCQRLEVLADQYSGVELTGTQKRLKRKMVAWHSRHCTRHARR
jgi:hypothetical protein